MQSGILTRFFLGSDSRYGYYSLYGSLLAREAGTAQYIIKGGNTYGKNVFLETLTKWLLAAGHDVEGFYSTTQPQYLDGIFIPGMKTAVLDGEPPHAVNALYPGAVETYIDLSPLYDAPKLKRERDKIVTLTAALNHTRAELYRYLCAAGEVRDNIAATVRGEKTVDTIRRRAKGIFTRELSKGSGGNGKVTNRFLSLSVSDGNDFASAAARCDRVCVIDNDFGLSHDLLAPLLRGAAGAGHDAVAFLDPLEPECVSHLTIPALGLAFISKTSRETYGGGTYKHYRLDALPRNTLSAFEKMKVKADRKLLSALLDKAGEAALDISGLAAAVGEVYTAHFDTGAAEALAMEFAEKLM